MKHKKMKQLYVKIIIIVLCLLIILRITTLVLSKYESITTADAMIDIAFYLLKEDYKTMTTRLPSILPQDGKYVYTFSIGNEDGSQRAEVDLVYDLKIRTTTNLPLTFELYMNQQHTDANATSAITSNNIEKDEMGTYFRTITTEQVFLDYRVGKTNIYQLVVNFPKTYNQEMYQDIIEMIEIDVNATQVME